MEYKDLVMFKHERVGLTSQYKFGLVHDTVCYITMADLELGGSKGAKELPFC